MPGTAKQIKAQSGHDPLSSDPKEAAQAAAFYLAELQSRYAGNLGMALAAYNAGPGNMDKAKKYGASWLSHMPAETRNYVPQIMGRIGQKVDYSVGAVDADWDSRSAYDRRRAAGLTTSDDDDAEYARRLGILSGEGVSADKLNGMSRDSILSSVFMALLGLVVKLGAQAFNAMQTPTPETPVTPAPGTLPSGTTPPAPPATPPVAVKSTAAPVLTPAH